MKKNINNSESKNSFCIRNTTEVTKCIKEILYKLRKYCTFYAKVDALSVVDLFKNFRKTFKEYDNLGSSSYVRAPGILWNAMLKITCAEK